MRPIFIIVSALTAFLIVGGGAFVAVLVAIGGDPLRPAATWVCIATGLIAAGKDIRATMSMPPLSNGNYQAIADMIRATKKGLPPDHDP